MSAIFICGLRKISSRRQEKIVHLWIKKNAQNRCWTSAGNSAIGIPVFRSSSRMSKLIMINDEPVSQPIVGSIYDVIMQLAAVHFQLTCLFFAGNSEIRKL